MVGENCIVLSSPQVECAVGESPLPKADRSVIESVIINSTIENTVTYCVRRMLLSRTHLQLEDIGGFTLLQYSVVSLELNC